MKKGYYLFPTYIKENGEFIFPGVMKKMEMQVNELSKWFDMSFKVIYAPENWTIFEHKILNRILPFYSQRREYRKCLDEMSSPSFVYIRKVEADREYIRFLENIRKKFPNVIILVEIPTYPYEKEAYKRIISKISLLKDRIYRKQYKKYIDRFVTFSDDESIFGVPTIRIQNGIDVSKIPIAIPHQNGGVQSI